MRIMIDTNVLISALDPVPPIVLEMQRGSRVKPKMTKMQSLASISPFR